MAKVYPKKRCLSTNVPNNHRLGKETSKFGECKQRSRNGDRSILSERRHNDHLCSRIRDLDRNINSHDNPLTITTKPK